MNGCLDKSDFERLKKWIHGNKRFTLLYKASYHGCSSELFHTKCNNKGATVSVFYNNHDTVYGGYNPRSWMNAGPVIEPDAFLFRLRLNGQRKPVQLKPKPWTGSEYSIFDDPNHGPGFGLNATSNKYYWVSLNGSINKSGASFQLNGTWDFEGNVFDMQGENADTMVNKTSDVKEIEIYGVEDIPLEKPWRKGMKWNEEFRKKFLGQVKNYKPIKNLGVTKANILLIGQIGAGKSSFYNTINSIFWGYYTGQALSGSADGSLTSRYHRYTVHDGEGKVPNFRLCDTRGIQGGKGIDDSTFTYLLDGNIPEHFNFDKPNTKGFITDPKLKDKIYVVAFVIDASIAAVMPDKLLESMKSLQKIASDKDVQQAVLLTKIDKICEQLSDNLSSVFHQRAIMECVEKVSQSIGLPRAHILPVKNYEIENDLDDGVDILALLAIRQLLRFANDFLYKTASESEDIEEESDADNSNFPTLA